MLKLAGCTSADGETHDLASNAILIYSSKALSRFDYILGKFGIAFTLLSLLCLAPLIAVWFVGNLLSGGFAGAALGAGVGTCLGAAGLDGCAATG